MNAADALSSPEARAVLRLSGHAGREEIARAFRAAAKRLHPDRPGGEAGAFRRAVAAYRRLLDDVEERESATRRSLRRFEATWAISAW